MLNVSVNKITHSTGGSSFSVTFSTPPEELTYLLAMYEWFKNMNFCSFPIERKDEPQSCESCVHRSEPWYSEACDGCCKAHSSYEPKDEQTDCPNKVTSSDGTITHECYRCEQTDCKETLCRHWWDSEKMCLLDKCEYEPWEGADDE